jgi:hypothetical protein
VPRLDADEVAMMALFRRAIGKLTCRLAGPRSYRCLIVGFE